MRFIHLLGTPFSRADRAHRARPRAHATAAAGDRPELHPAPGHRRNAARPDCARGSEGPLQAPHQARRRAQRHASSTVSGCPGRARHRCDAGHRERTIDPASAGRSAWRSPPRRVVRSAPAVGSHHHLAARWRRRRRPPAGSPGTDTETVVAALRLVDDLRPLGRRRGPRAGKCRRSGRCASTLTPPDGPAQRRCYMGSARTFPAPPPP